MLIIAIIVCAGLIGLDQLIKYLVVENLQGNGVVVFIDGFLNFTYAENTGVAFSIFSGGNRWFITACISIVLIVLLAGLFTKKIKQPFLIWSTVFIIAGGAGNLIDRIFRGYVVDYIDAAFLKNFAVFNFADCLVVAGTAMMIFYILIYEPFRDRRKEKEKETDAIPEHSS